MKLQQGQIWQLEDRFLRIIKWARMSIEYKAMKDPFAKEGTVHQVSKKEFCRLVKEAKLMTPDDLTAHKDGLAKSTIDEPPLTPAVAEQLED